MILANLFSVRGATGAALPRSTPKCMFSVFRWDRSYLNEHCPRWNKQHSVERGRV